MPSQEPLVDDDKSGEEVELPPEDPEETDSSRSPSPLVFFYAYWGHSLLCQRALRTVDRLCSTSGLGNVKSTQLKGRGLIWSVSPPAGV